MPRYEIDLVRVAEFHAGVTVEAESEDEARRIALERVKHMGIHPDYESAFRSSFSLLGDRDKVVRCEEVS